MSSPRTCGVAPVPPTDEGGAAVRPASRVRAAPARDTRVTPPGRCRGAGDPAGPAAPTGASTDRWHLARACVRAHLRQARALWRDFTGESAYDRYVERHAREHPDHAPMTERQFWRARADFDEENVSTGCC